LDMLLRRLPAPHS